MTPRTAPGLFSTGTFGAHAFAISCARPRNRATSTFRSNARIWAGSVESSTSTSGNPSIRPNVSFSTSGQRLEPPMPSRSARVKPSRATSSATRRRRSMRLAWSSAIPSQPSQLASSALVQRLASRAQRRRTFPAAAHSSSVFRTRFSRSGGSVRVWPSIATNRGETRTPVVPCAAPTRRRSRRPALPSQLAHGDPVGDEDGVRGPEEEPRVHDAGNRADPALEPGRVRDRSHRAVQDDVSVVGHEGTLGGHPERGTGAERRAAAPAQGQRERDDLDGQPTPAAEPRNELVTLDKDDLAPRRRRHDALAHQGSAVPLDQVEVGIDLVGSVHRDIDIRLEADQRDAELPRELGRRLRDGHASHAEAVAHAGGESPQERCRGSARAEPHGGVVLDDPEGPASERTERFRWVEVHAFRPHNTIRSPPPAYPHGLLPRTAGIPPVLALIARARRMRAWTLSLRCCSSPR